MFIFRTFTRPTFYFNTPEPGGSAGGAGGAGVQPGAAPGTPAAPGAVVDPVQGAAPTNPDFWGMFPNVPEEHRALLEPHLKDTQGHVTKLEQQLAPFKPFLDSGLTPESAAGLMKFSADFDSDPLGMWVKIGEMLQSGDTPVVHPDVDLEYLAAIARGEDPDAGVQVDEGVVPTGAPVDPAQGAPHPQVAELQETVRQLQARLDQTDQQTAAQQRQQQEAAQDALFSRQLTKMRETLETSGYPKDSLTDEIMVSAVISHRGQFEAATKAFLDQRAAILKGFTQNNQEPDELNMPNGVPSTTPKDEPRGRDRNDPFAKARPGAKAFLRHNNRAAAQN